MQKRGVRWHGDFSRIRKQAALERSVASYTYDSFGGEWAHGRACERRPVQFVAFDREGAPSSAAAASTERGHASLEAGQEFQRGSRVEGCLSHVNCYIPGKAALSIPTLFFVGYRSCILCSSDGDVHAMHA